MSGEDLTVEQVALAHFKYLTGVEDYCHGSREEPPGSSPEEYDFGRWLKQRRARGEEVPQELVEAHLRFHEITSKARELKGTPEGERCLDEAYSLFARIEHLLNSLE